MVIDHYSGLPDPPYQIKLEVIPDLVKLSLFPIRHVEPLTSTIIHFAGDVVENTPNNLEWNIYEKCGAHFQLIFVVINSFYAGRESATSQLHPYSISLIPASKRGKVEICKLPFVKSMVGSAMFREGAAYMGLDPFVGDWQCFSDVGLLASLGASQGFTDEMGLVYDYFFLNIDVKRDDIVQPGLDMPPERLRRYLKHRSKLLYTPLVELKARQVWGVENALEMFVMQEFIRRSMPNAVPRALLFNDGSWHPAMYHAWYEYQGENTDLISEVDFFFPEERIAIFCDGGTHRRRIVKNRDTRIDAALAGINVLPLRLRSDQILQSVRSAVDQVQEAFKA